MTTYALRYGDEGFAVVLNEDGTPFASQHMSTARSHALHHAARVRVPVIIGTLHADDVFKARLVIRPDGSAGVPDGMKPPPGPEHAPNENGVCFCLNCRAARRNA